MTRVPSPFHAELVVGIVVDTSENEGSSLFRTLLSSVITDWADTARLDARRGRARVAFVGAGQPVATLDSTGARGSGSGSTFVDLADVVAPPLPPAGRAIWVDAIDHALRLCEQEAIVAASDGGRVPILLMVLSGTSFGQLPGSEHERASALGHRLAQHARARRVYTLAAGHSPSNEVTALITPDSYVPLEPLRFEPALALLTRAINLLTLPGESPPEAIGFFRRVMSAPVLAEPHTPHIPPIPHTPLGPEPPRVPEQGQDLPHEPAPYTPLTLPPLRYQPRRSAVLRQLLLAFLAITLATSGALAWTGHPEFAVACLGLLFVAAIGFLFVPGQ